MRSRTLMSAEGTNRDMRRWWSRYASPVLRIACASVGGKYRVSAYSSIFVACGDGARSCRSRSAVAYSQPRR